MHSIYKRQVYNKTMSVNWTKLYEDYKGLWVALAEDEVTVIASSKNAKEAYELAVKRGVKVPIMHNVPLKVEAYVG